MSQLPLFDLPPPVEPKLAARPAGKLAPIDPAVRQDYRFWIVWLAECGDLVWSESPSVSYRFAMRCVTRALRPDSEILEAVAYHVNRRPPPPEGIRKVEMPRHAFPVATVVDHNHFELECQWPTRR